MEDLEQIRGLINKGDVGAAITALEAYIGSSTHPDDEAYYLLGNAYRKQGNWQMALNNYLTAIEINSESPAVQAREMLMNILNFYNKEMYNH